MECYYHPSRESTDVCAICGKSICKECGLEIGGKIYCKECLEKIVGLSLDDQQAPSEEPPRQEPARLQRQEVPQEQVQSASMPNQPEEVQFSNQRVADDSPYNIKDNIKYESGLESSYDEAYQPRGSLQDAIESNQVPQQPVEDVRQEYVPPRQEIRQEPIPQQPVMEERIYEPVSQARNENDYVQRRPQAPPSDDYIYPDHSYDPGETSARQAVEDKYERYLDDLYYDEVDEIPLNEQLARDEQQYGSLTRNEYQPRNTHEQKVSEDDDLDRRIREELHRREEEKNQSPRGRIRGRNREDSIHNITYEEEKEPYGAVDIILTIILIIVIIIVLLYILYIFRLSATYPTFIDAMLGLKNPGTFINALISG